VKVSGRTKLADKRQKQRCQTSHSGRTWPLLRHQPRNRRRNECRRLLAQLLHDTSAEVMADADDEEAGYEQEISLCIVAKIYFKMHTYRDGIFKYARRLHPVSWRWGRHAHGRKTAELFHSASFGVRGLAAYNFPTSAHSISRPGATERNCGLKKKFPQRRVGIGGGGNFYQEEEGLYE